MVKLKVKFFHHLKISVSKQLINIVIKLELKNKDIRFIMWFEHTIPPHSYVWGSIPFAASAGC